MIRRLFSISRLSLLLSFISSLAIISIVFIGLTYWGLICFSCLFDKNKNSADLTFIIHTINVTGNRKLLISVVFNYLSAMKNKNWLLHSIFSHKKQKLELL